ncbi:MAG: GDP-mannose 4,6-dehydratase [Victivallales bacterium]|jgi:UDP-glucose 4-epimerase|nr:GDP-mannose 4,6-dehydratase [Victivallales bacterium]
MRYLVTGGAGFIGGHLTEALLGDGHEVVVIDNYSTGSVKNLSQVAGNPKLRIIEADILEFAELLDSEIARCDAVFHLAAAVGVELVVKDPVRTITTNVHGTENVLKPAAKYHKRIIVASTSEVYGKSTLPEFTESDDLLIGSPYHSRWSYACSKLLDEFYVMAFHRSADLPGTVVRFFNTVGPRQTGMYGMVIPRFVERALKGDALQVYGDGTQSRCFCHVTDVVRALRLLIDRPESYGQIYNIGSRRSITIAELAKLVIERTGSRSKIEYLSYDKAYAKGFEDMMRRMPNTEAIRQLTDWQPELTLEKVIDDVKNSLG